MGYGFNWGLGVE
jgi:hypothetical protein